MSVNGGLGIRLQSKRLDSYLLLTLCALGLALVIGHAWVAEDAYITFRVVENAVNGHGLRWNVDERVEVYTNPLWMLLHIPLRALHPNLFLSTIVFSVLCSAGAVCAAAKAAPRGSLQTALLLILPLALSKSFVEFATSGLENPLSFLLAGLFAWVLLTKSRRPERTPWFYLFLLAALAAFNRMDTLLLYVPVLAYLTISRFRWVRWKAVLAGMSPFLLWKLFSFWYYGFPFPNTAYAKLATGASRLLYAEQGIYYAADLLRRDPVGFVLVLGAFFLGGRFVWRLTRRRLRAPDLLGAFAAGVALYSLYVIAVGGDFMTLRFWSVPVFCAAVLTLAVLKLSDWRQIILWVAALAVLKAATVWSEPAEITVEGKPKKAWHGISDERLGYLHGHALFSPRREQWFRFSLPEYKHSKPQVIMWYAIGVNAYCSGPDVIVVDGLALGDALLARLPALPREDGISIGHFKRGIPKGYMQARLTDSTQWMNRDLSRYYREVRVITAGPLFSIDRLKTILRFNRGAYDGLLEAYLRSDNPYAKIEKGRSLFLLDTPKANPYRKAGADDS